MFMPTIVLDGRVVGIWKRSLKKNSVALIAYPFTALRKAAFPALVGAAESYGQYMHLPLTLS